MTDEARNDRDVERHDRRRCDICGEAFDRDQIHDGVCDWCSDDAWDAGMDDDYDEEDAR